MTETAELTATTTPMHLTVDPDWDLIEVLAYGTVTDLIGSDRYIALVEDHLALVLGPNHDEITGFVVRESASFDVLAHEDVEELWDGPRFRVPVLGLTGASVGEILLAIRGRFAADEPTADAMHFHGAMQETDPSRAVAQWQLALEAGDMKAHYALGYTLCELELFREAYDHLRHYTELAPNNPWAWCWLGQACEGADRTGEARKAYAQAVALDPEETDAGERLALLGEAGTAEEPTEHDAVTRCSAPESAVGPDDAPVASEHQIRVAVAALIPFVRAGWLHLNPENLELIAFAVLKHASTDRQPNDALYDEVDADVRQLITEEEAAQARMSEAMRQAIDAKRAGADDSGIASSQEIDSVDP